MYICPETCFGDETAFFSKAVYLVHMQESHDPN